MIQKACFYLLVLIGTLYFVDLISPSFDQLFHSIIEPYAGVLETSLKLAIPFLLTMGCMGWIGFIIGNILMQLGFRVLTFTSIGKHMAKLSSVANDIMVNGFVGGIVLIMACKALGFQEIANDGIHTIFPNQSISIWDGFVKIVLFTCPVAVICFFAPFSLLLSPPPDSDYSFRKVPPQREETTDSLG